MYPVNRYSSVGIEQTKPATPHNSSWYAQLAQAWGSALDKQADKTAALAQQLADGEVKLVLVA
ncbi:MAG: hypothetical protein AAF438_20830 [Pseudomonadota bacterium]